MGVWDRYDKGRTIYFDMDGTIADLYAVPDVYHRLDIYDATPYRDASPIKESVSLFKSAMEEGRRIGVLTHLGRPVGGNPNPPAFDAQTIEYKKNWLKENGLVFDEFKALPHGTNKYEAADDKTGILVDDDDKVLSVWQSDKVKAQKGAKGLFL